MPHITVMARFRPAAVTGREGEAGEGSCVSVDRSKRACTWNGGGGGGAGSRASDAGDVFTFDNVFSGQGVDASGQGEVYEAVRPSVRAVASGQNATLLAYGQTGGGKTWTMLGKADDPGVVPRAARDLIETAEGGALRLSCSCLEVYGEKIRDLLDPSKEDLQVKSARADGEVQVEGATELDVHAVEDIMQLFDFALQNRIVGSTRMNSQSSRSHCVVVLRAVLSCGAEGKLTLVDLAGSERVDKTGAEGQLLEEAVQINKSLSALGNTVMALSEGAAFVPYRDSKLTRLLSPSLGGNSKTCIIICCSPSTYNAAETLSSLRFGRRAKKIENAAPPPPIAAPGSAAELRLELAKLRVENDGLRRRQDGASGGGGVGSLCATALSLGILVGLNGTWLLGLDPSGL